MTNRGLNRSQEEKQETGQIIAKWTKTHGSFVLPHVEMRRPSIFNEERTDEQVSTCSYIESIRSPLFRALVASDFWAALGIHVADTPAGDSALSLPDLTPDRKTHWSAVKDFYCCVFWKLAERLSGQREESRDLGLDPDTLTSVELCVRDILGLYDVLYDGWDYIKAFMPQLRTTPSYKIPSSPELMLLDIITVEANGLVYDAYPELQNGGRGNFYKAFGGTTLYKKRLEYTKLVKLERSNTLDESQRGRLEEMRKELFDDTWSRHLRAACLKACKKGRKPNDTMLKLSLKAYDFCQDEICDHEKKAQHPSRKPRRLAWNKGRLISF
jgi:hypothetical protein